MQHVTNTKQNKKGFALILCLIVIMVLAIMATVLINRSVVDGRNTDTFSNGVRAFWLAEAGIQRTLWEYNHGYGMWAGWTQTGLDKTQQWSLGTAGDYEVTVIDYASETPEVIATGYFPSRVALGCITRTINAIIGRGESLFQYAAFGKEAIELKGTMNTDSYNSDNGPYGGSNINQNGDIGTNGDITGVGDFKIAGDAQTGPDGTFEDPDGTHVSGEITHDSNLELPYIPPPDYLVSAPSQGRILSVNDGSSQTIAPGNYQFTYITILGGTLTITGPAEIYLTDKNAMKIQGTGQIVIDEASTGKVKIYFDGDVDVGGGGIVNSTLVPANLLLVGTGTSQDVKLMGGEKMYAAVYAPNSDLTIGGNGEYYGSYIGNKVTSIGTSYLHYDEALSDEDMGISFFQTQRWLDGQNSYAVYP